MKVHIKVWTTDLKECETFIFPCTLQMKSELVKRFVEALEAAFPENHFNLIPIGQHRYNVVPENPASA